MDPPVRPPLQPMLAKLARELPDGAGWSYEPKWDGFRCLVFRDGDDVDLRSRNQRPFSRYFPELADAFLAVACERFVVDGEIVVVRGGRFDFDALMTRLHPAKSWVEDRARETPASFVAFDAVAIDDDDLRSCAFVERRHRLEALLASAPPPIHLTPSTRDRHQAEEWLRTFTGGGLDGVVAKPDELAYQPGKRAMIKVKTQRTVDCVVAGFRWLASKPVVSSLLLGVYDVDGALHHLGVAASFTTARRHELLTELRPHVTTLEGHPWEHGFGIEGGRLGRLKGTAGRWVPDMGLDWVPLRPELVCEVEYDQVESLRFRHPARFVRWRPDRSASSCTVDQLQPTEAAAWPTP